MAAISIIYPLPNSAIQIVWRGSLQVTHLPISMILETRWNMPTIS